MSGYFSKLQTSLYNTIYIKQTQQRIPFAVDSQSNNLQMWSKYGQNQMGPGGSGQAGGNPGAGGSGGFIGQGPGGMIPVQPGMAQQMQYNPMQQQMQMQQQMSMGPGGGPGMVGVGGGMQPGPGQMSMVPNVAAMPNPMAGNLMQQQQQQQQMMMSGINMLPAQLQQPQQMPTQMIPTSVAGVNVVGGVGMPMGGNISMAQQQLPQQQQNQPPPLQQIQPQQLPLQSLQPTQQQQQQQPQLTSAQQNPNPGSNNNMLAISQPNTHKEINIVQLSRLGQETVQDIASRFQEVFSALKSIQPTPHRDNSTEKKVQEYFRTIRLLFKRVRIIYEKCNDAGMDYTHVESLIPYKDEQEARVEAATQCEEYRKSLQENQELIETVKLKNRQLREVIDRTRIIIWEINTMLSMRRS